MSLNTNNSLCSFKSSDNFNEKEEQAPYINREKNQVKRKISKISLKLEELKDKINPIEENDLDISTDYVDIDSDESLDNSINLENIKTENIFSKFVINFSFSFNEKEFLVPIESDFFNLKKNSVLDLVVNIINKINEKNIIFKYNKIKYIISLKDNDDQDFYKANYELRNYDTNNFYIYPFDLLLSNIKDTKLNFVSKNYLNIMIRKL